MADLSSVWNGKKYRMACFHPLTVFIYFMSLLLPVIIMFNPIFEFICLIFGFATLLYFEGVEAVRFLLKLIPFGLVLTLINPLLSHQGSTVITYFHDGNALTLESIYYGIGIGVLFITSLVGFMLLTKAMWADRWVELLGNVWPNFGLILSMTFRFIKRFKGDYRRIKDSNADITALKAFSVLISYGLETSVDTADSMAARGYGLRKRTYYSKYDFTYRDLIICALSVGSLILLLTGFYTENIRFYFYPNVMIYGDIYWYIAGLADYIILALIPVFLQIVEDIRWRY